MDNDSLDIDCPACGTTMKKIYMPQQKVYLDVCSEGCGGVFFDNKEIKLFEKPESDITPLQTILNNNSKFKKVDENVTRQCSICGMNMVKHYLNTVTVDECYGCGGLFLDHLELDKIRNHSSSAHSKGINYDIPEKYHSSNVDFSESEAEQEMKKFVELSYEDNSQKLNAFSHLYNSLKLMLTNCFNRDGKVISYRCIDDEGSEYYK